MSDASSMDLDPSSLIGAFGPNMSLWQLVKLRRIAPGYRAELYAQADAVLRNHPDVPAVARALYAKWPAAQPHTEFAYNMLLFTAQVLGQSPSEHLWRAARALLRADLIIGSQPSVTTVQDILAYVTALVGKDVLKKPWTMPEIEAIAGRDFPRLVTVVELFQEAGIYGSDYAVSTSDIFGILYGLLVKGPANSAPSVIFELALIAGLMQSRVIPRSAFYNLKYRFEKTTPSVYRLVVPTKDRYNAVSFMTALCADYLYEEPLIGANISIRHVHDAWADMFGEVIKHIPDEWKHRDVRLYSVVLEDLINVNRTPVDPVHFESAYYRYVIALPSGFFQEQSRELMEVTRVIRNGEFEAPHIYHASAFFRETAHALLEGNATAYWSPERVGACLTNLFKWVPPTDADREVLHIIGVENQWPTWVAAAKKF